MLNEVIFIEKKKEKSNYLVRFSFTRFSVRMIIVSFKYFMRGDTAWNNITLTDITCIASTIATNTTATRISAVENLKLLGLKQVGLTSSLLMESGDRLMCWMYLRSSGSICMKTVFHERLQVDTHYCKNTISFLIYSKTKIFIVSGWKNTVLTSMTDMHKSYLCKNADVTRFLHDSFFMIEHFIICREIHGLLWLNGLC